MWPIFKNCADLCRQHGKKIILMGIDFDMEKRNVGEWKISHINSTEEN